MKKDSIALVFILVALLLVSSTGSHAQEIKLVFPHFTGQSYDWNIFQGETTLAVESGVIDSQGRVTLTMPEAHKNYRGMTRWLLKTGGGLDMIYVGKGFSVECLSNKPGPGNIIYTGNPENDYLAAQHRRQQIILDKLGVVDHFLQVYTSEEALHQKISEEQKDLRKRFARVQADRAKSLFYAARFGEIVDFTRGITDKIYDNPEGHTAYFNDFVTNTLNFEDLYTSGHWDQVLHHWLMMNIRSKNEMDAFNERLHKILKCMEQDNIRTAFAQKAVLLLVQMGKDSFLSQIKEFFDKHPNAKAGLSDRVKHMLESFKILTGKKAPDLKFKAPFLTQKGRGDTDFVLKPEGLGSGYTILLFYRGECQSCEDALITLSNQYKSLKDRNVRVVAISADESEQSFAKKLAYHQWPDNYCDFLGMTGSNFKNYAVLGTPMLYLLDRRGIVLEKTAVIEDLLKTLSNQ